LNLEVVDDVSNVYVAEVVEDVDNVAKVDTPTIEVTKPEETEEKDEKALLLE